jgi:tetratricopeptide (TPR) repeat protein
MIFACIIPVDTNNMTYKETQQKADNIASFLEKRQLKNAFEGVRALIEISKEWIFQEELDRIETTYKYMLQYMLEGADDPERDKVHNDLLRTTFELANKVAVSLHDKNNAALYYQNRRNQEINNTLSYNKLSAFIEEETTKISFSDLLKDKDSEGALQASKQLESLSSQLFYKVWLSNALNQDEAAVLRKLLQEPTPLQTQCLLVSALTLALKEFFDEEKLLLLFEAYGVREEEIRQRALIGILLVLYRYDQWIYLYPEVYNRLSHWMEHPDFIKNIHLIVRQFILTKETEKISKKISEELMPEMMKITPTLRQKITGFDLMDDAGVNDKNPDWMNLLDESGLTDKLQEINQLQIEGADVMHSSFSNLKMYPFFQELSNWFLPFSSSHSALKNGSDSYVMEIVHIIDEMGYMCNSDKYSLCFSMIQIPESYRKMMSAQMSAEISEMLKQEKEDNSLLRDKRAETISNQYIHDLYRFYKVHPRRQDFEDVFSTPLAIHKTRTIGQFIADRKSLLSIGSYYFDRNQLADARDIFIQLTKEEGDADAVLFQKIGYCEQMEGNIEAALAAYLKADLIDSGHSWTLKKVAHCYRILKKPEEALVYYQKAERLSPDNLSVQLNIGHCYLELKKYKDALKSYFKVEYLNSSGAKLWRPIAWSSFLSGKFEQAAQYYDKILSAQPEMIDYVNYGHTLLAMKQHKRAISLYKLAAEASQHSQEKFIQMMNEDTPELILAGIKERDIPIIVDQVLYALG